MRPITRALFVLAVGLLSGIAFSAEIKAPPPPPPTLAVNEVSAPVQINGRVYDCTSTDYGGRYETACTPRGE